MTAKLETPRPLAYRRRYKRLWMRRKRDRLRFERADMLAILLELAGVKNYEEREENL